VKFKKRRDEWSALRAAQVKEASFCGIIAQSTMLPRSEIFGDVLPRRLPEFRLTLVLGAEFLWSVWRERRLRTRAGSTPVPPRRTPLLAPR